jgi:chemotaxis protein CheZ
MAATHETNANGEVVTAVEELLVELRQGNDERAGQLLEQVASIWNVSLYQAVGKVTRQLHDSLQDFRFDSRIDALAQDEIPDAQQRLQYVITMTQQAADRTMSAVEDSMPRCEGLSSRAEVLQVAWKRFRNREMNADEFRDLSKQIEAFLGETRESTAKVKNNLNDVLMAQDFQDLTGQVIKRVITLVQEVEGKLVDLIRITGNRLQADAPQEKVDPIKAEGPVIAGVNDKGTVSGQDEVDDLLSSLGF